MKTREAQIESEDEEWKESWKPENMATLSAFATGEGGKMIIGKSDNGTVIGVQNVKRLLKVIPDMVSNKLGIAPTVKHVIMEGKDCIEIIIEKEESPVPYEQKFYVRSGSTTREITGDKLKTLLVESLETPWTDRITTKAKLEDISSEAVKEFVIRGKECGRIPESADENDVEGTLRNFNLMTDEGITLAGALLFLKDPRRVFNEAVVRIGLTSEEGRLLMDDIIVGPVIMMPEEASRMLHLRYVQPRYEIEGVYRVDKYRYPPKALREALLNAVIHRAYYLDGEITVRVYENRVEIYNPGQLPKGWSVERLMEGHESISPNKTMATAFYSANLIERWGTGIKTMREECRKNNNPDPEFKIEEDGIRVIFRPCEKRDEGSGEKVSPETLGLTNIEFNVYQIILTEKVTTAAEISKIVGKTDKTVRRALKKLIENGFIERTGGDKKGKWVPITRSK